MAAAMPEALDWNHAVKGALVVVCGCERVSNLPEIYRRTHYLPSETQQLSMRASRFAGKICERDLYDDESPRVCFDQDFLQHFEIGALKIEIRQRVAAVKPVSAGQVPHRHREHPPEHGVQKPAARAADERGVRDAAARITRRDHDVAALA